MADLDIWRWTKLLMGHQGVDAPIRAAERADEVLATGNMEGRAVRLRILEAIKELQSTNPPGSVH